MFLYRSETRQNKRTAMARCMSWHLRTACLLLHGAAACRLHGWASRTYHNSARTYTHHCAPLVANRSNLPPQALITSACARLWCVAAFLARDHGSSPAVEQDTRTALVAALWTTISILACDSAIGDIIRSIPPPRLRHCRQAGTFIWDSSGRTLHTCAFAAVWLVLALPFFLLTARHCLRAARCAAAAPGTRCSPRHPSADRHCFRRRAGLANLPLPRALTRSSQHRASPCLRVVSGDTALLLAASP